MRKHADGIVSFFDSILQVLGKSRKTHHSLIFVPLNKALTVSLLCRSITGPDVEFIEEILCGVGKRHSKLGVSPSFFPYLGTALVYALEETLGASNFSPADRNAWEKVYEIISAGMIKAMLED